MQSVVVENAIAIPPPHPTPPELMVMGVSNIKPIKPDGVPNVAVSAKKHNDCEGAFQSLPFSANKPFLSII